MAATYSWDVFCTVVDNFGDIGVCWRLSRQLAVELGQTVRLWVDSLETFAHICHAVDPALALQEVDGVQIRRWPAQHEAVVPADIVVEGFGTRLPDGYLAAMAERDPRPVWINLEYLSAEDWVEGCHGLPSPHPRLPLVKYFYFPGFTAATGGLLAERGLFERRDAFIGNRCAMREFWQALGCASADSYASRMSLFCYGNRALPSLIEAWSRAREPVLCVVSDGGVRAQLTALAGQRLVPAAPLKLGQLTLLAIPFLPQDQYDRLLWACDVNFVRGEDSFVRAQWAGRPLVWHAYPQQEDAHLNKLAAFMDRYTTGLDAASGAVCRTFHEAWNRQDAGAGALWPTLSGLTPALKLHAREWAEQLSAVAGLAARLAEFCGKRLQ